VKAKTALLFPREVYLKLLVMDVPEITRFIGESQYRDEVNELALKYSGIDLTEYALSLNLANEYRQIISFCKGNLRTMMTEYLRRWDVWNLKTILRGKFYNAAEDEILKTIVSAGVYDLNFWTALVNNTKTVDDVINYMKKTEYYTSLNTIRESMEKIVIGQFEDKLEIEYYTTLQESIKPTSKPTRLFLEFVKKEIDMKNLETLLMTKYEDVEPQKIYEYMIPGGYELDMTKLKKIVYLQFDEIFGELDQFSFYPDIKDEVALIESKKTLTAVVRSAEKHLFKYAQKFSHLHPLSVIPVLNYIIRKKLEADNIRIIARGKESGLSEDVIKDMLVIL
jgi:V/A-type H+-transporting ATPase subunit C